MGIILNQISKAFPNIKEKMPLQVLEKVDLSIAPGEFVALLGPSGCGKSTLLSIIAGSERVGGGEASVNGRPITGPGPDRAIVFQEAALFPWLTVIENIAFAVREGSRREKIAKASRYIKLVHLDRFRDAYPHQLSGGMKQRVAIARAFAAESEILLMDEPFASLDEQTRMILQAELVQIWRNMQKTIVFVTHNIREAIYLADRIVLLSARPARVIEVFPVRIPRPRSTNNSTALKLETQILELLKVEIAKVVKEEIGEEYLLETTAGGFDLYRDLGMRL